MIPPMVLDYMSWEAFMALLTGCLAVGAALWVGLRQTGIAQRQAEIQDHQVRISRELAGIEKLKVRADLYDRRLDVFASVDDWLRHVVQFGEPPAISGETHMLTRRRFESAMLTSRFLFRPIVHETISHYWKLGNDLHYANQCLEMETDHAQHAADRTRIVGTLARALTHGFADLVSPEMELGQRQVALEDQAWD